MIDDEKIKDSLTDFEVEQARTNRRLLLLEIQAKQRFRLIKFLFMGFGSVTIFTLLFAITGISYEYTEQTGTRWAYRAPTVSEEIIKIALPSVGSFLVLIVSSKLKQSDPEDEENLPINGKNNKA